MRLRFGPNSMRMTRRPCAPNQPSKVPPSDLPPAGWYADPEHGMTLRWWDGHGWTDQRTASGSGDWRNWLTSSTTSLLIDRGIALGAGIGALAGLVVVASTFLTSRPIPGLALLLIPGVPVLVAGQFWVIGVLNARLPQPGGGWWSTWKSQVRAQKNSRKFLFGALPAPVAYPLIAAIFLGWLAVLTSFPALSQGNPSNPLPGCPWALSNHGFVTCVSETRFLETSAAAQRAASGVLAFFFTMHFGVAVNELVRRRATGDGS
jgi:hypothetical protein